MERFQVTTSFFKTFLIYDQIFLIRPVLGPLWRIWLHLMVELQTAWDKNLQRIFKKDIFDF